MMFRNMLCVCLIAAMALVGCSTTQMETARQLEQGEWVMSGSLDIPGSFIIVIPRANANLRYGFPVGDLSVYGGSSLVMSNLGVGGRLYLSEQMTFSLQSDVTTETDDLMDWVSGDRFFDAHMTITPRLSTAVTGERMFYAGLETPIPVDLGGTRYTVDGPNGVERNGVWARGGAFLGVDIFTRPHRGQGVQLEFIFRPIVLTENGLEEGFGDADPFFQFSVGLYFRRPPSTPELAPSKPSQREEPRRVPEQDRWTEPERSEEPQPRRERGPEYDDDGVPVY